MTIADDPTGLGPNTIPGFANTRPGGAVPPAAQTSRLDPEVPDPGRLRFSGDGGEYFKIWAVNLALTILTLGIYSAWAKVRRLRYFYGNTSLQGSTFDFHGRPAAILRGRIVALVFFVLYTQSAKFSIALFVGTVCVIAMLLPWLFYRSLRFRLGNTSYRGIRFHFGGSIGGAYALFTPMILLVLTPNFLLVILAPGGKPPIMVSFELLALYFLILVFWPYFLHRLRTYQHGAAFFGGARFTYRGTPGMFYILMLKCVGLMFVAGTVAGVIVAVFVGASGLAGAPHPPTAGVIPKSTLLLIVLYVVVVYGTMLALVPYWMSRSQNIVWGNTALDGHTFHSDLPFKKLFGIEAANLFLTLITLGIFRPFAAVRSARVRLEAVSYAGDVGVFESAAAPASGATGAEFVDMFGFDISL